MKQGSLPLEHVCTGLYCGYRGLVCGNAALFCGNVGLFCGDTELFCRYVELFCRNIELLTCGAQLKERRHGWDLCANELYTNRGAAAHTTIHCNTTPWTCVQKTPTQIGTLLHTMYSYLWKASANLTCGADLLKQGCCCTQSLPIFGEPLLIAVSTYVFGRRKCIGYNAYVL